MKQKILTIGIAAFISSIVLAFAWATAWAFYIIFGH